MRPPEGSRGSKSPGHILMGSGLPNAKLPCSRAPLHPFQGSTGFHLSKFKKATMGIVWAQGLQAFKMAGSRAPVTPSPLRASIKMRPWLFFWNCSNWETFLEHAVDQGPNHWQLTWGTMVQG